MSTNINPEQLPDLHELEKLANQFFKEFQGGSGEVVPSIAPTQPPVAVQQFTPLFPGAENINAVPNSGGNSPASAFSGFDGAPYSRNFSPGSSPSGIGASPSAINQGSAFNLKEPQTSFEDPALKGSQPSPQSIQAPFNQSGHDLPAQGLLHLPYQQQQPFEKELRELLNGINSNPFIPQNPFVSFGSSDPSFYFLNKGAVLSSVKTSSGLHGGIIPPLDVNVIRKDFPILKENVNGKQLVWLDNAATTQKPNQVIDRISYFYEHENSNIHRAAHELAARATDAYEGARKKVQAFLNAGSVNEIIFVRGATEAINLVAKSWGEQFLQEGDEIILSNLEHHANIVPWQQLAAKKNLKIRVIPVDDDGQVIIDEYIKLLNPKTRLVAFTQVSNALGTVTPAAQIVHLGHLAGAKVLVDGAQSVSHMPVDVRALNADWFVFSGHKVFGPTGIGVLYGKEDLLNETQPWQGGGNMIVDVTFEHTQYHNAPGRFEAGTGNIADAVGLGAAIDYVSKIGMQAISQYEHYLLVYATQLLQEIPGIRLIGTAKDKASVLSFTLEGYKTEEVGAELNKEGIAVRSGHHCAQPILRRFGVESTVRPSLAFYNTCAEVDLLVNTLHRLKSKNGK